MAIPVFGTNGEAIVGACTDVRHILESPTGGEPDFDGDGRVFELLTLEAYNSHAGSRALLVLYDANEGSGPAGSQDVQKGVSMPIAAGTLMVKTWAKGQGPRFSTNITAETAASAGTIARGDVFASGLLH